jgi:predicted nuclease of restriction endonuclease-like (RecB) superfamily
MKKNPMKNTLYHSIKTLIENAKSNIVRSVNTTIILTYYEIGRMIFEEEQDGEYRADYAKKVLAQLSNQLTKKFGKGYSLTNLEYFRKFYRIYSNRIPQSAAGKSQKPLGKAIPQSVIEEFKAPFVLSWTHYIQLLKIENNDERTFYEIEAAQGNWSVRELQRQFNSSLFERLALSKDKKTVRELGTKGQIIEKPTDALKHHTVLEFLDLKEDERYTESDLENAIISKLEHFMMELGKGFLFEGRQKRFIFDGDDFYVDLVFYNRLLKCFVLLDLKIGRLTHRDIGQIQMYVNYYDRKIKLPDENSTIGIILCKEENKTVVEFTLPEDNKTIFAKEYKLYLPSKDELRKQLE